MKKLLLLDIDDTICNASKAYDLALGECYKFLKEKYPLINKKLFKETYLKAREQIHLELADTASSHNRFLYFQRMFELLGLSLQPQLLDDLTELYWNETLKNLKIFPKVKETLRLVKENNLKVGVVSDLTAHIQIKKIEKLKIADYIDFIVSSEEAGKEKPHPTPFLLALEKAGCLPEQAVMVGDSIEKDVLGAKNLGITSILFSSKISKKIKPEFTIKNFKELQSILKLKERNISNKKMIAFDLMGCFFKENHIIKKLLFPLVKQNKLKVSYLKLKQIYLDYSVGKIGRKEFNKIIPLKLEEKFLDLIKPISNIFSIIDSLKKKGFLLGILSNIPKPWGNYLVKKFKLENYFTVIVFSGEYNSRKPSEKLYDIFIEKARVKPQNCFFVDDNLANLREARFMLMKTVWVKKEKQDISFIPDIMLENSIEFNHFFGGL
ncbi:MAG: HAD-IA family hydrolase [archaeon]